MADRRSFGSVVALGLAGAGLAALAGTETWVTAEGCGVTFSTLSGTSPGEAPAAAALALALLASWGAMLVTRGRVRRFVSVLTALLALALAAAVVLGVRAARENVLDRAAELGADCTGTGLTGWFWAAVVALLPAVGAALAAVRLVPTWPEMGRRYDAPAESAPQAEQPPEERENLDLWKAMDEGRDPTA